MSDPADLVSPEEAAAFLKLGSPSSDPRLPTFITRASLAAEGVTSRLLRYRTLTNLRLQARSGYRLPVPLFPVDDSATATIVFDGNAQTVWRKESDGNIDTFDVVLGSSNAFDDALGLRDHFWRPLGWGGESPQRGMFWQPSTPPQMLLKQHPFFILASFSGGYGTAATDGTGTASVPEDLKMAVCYILQRYYRDVDKQQTDITVINVPSGGSLSFLDNVFPKRALEILASYRPMSLSSVAV